MRIAPTISAHRRNLSSLFDPKSIAIVGASDNPAKYGNWLAVRALRGSRPVHLINRTSPSVLGRSTAPSIGATGSSIDLAVIAVPAARFDEAVDDAISAGVRAVVAITAGLGESGGDALVRQRALVEKLSAAGVSMLGPNCLGVLDTTTGLDATVNDFAPGSVSIISQSGNVAIDVGDHLITQGLGVARFASLGNCADLDAADLVDSCVDHDGTRAIAVYCEGFGDGRKFARAAARAHEVGKPVVLLSVGRGAASARGAASHTGSLVTSNTVLQAMCEATGAELVSSPHEMVALLQAMVTTRPPRGRRVAVLADGGGHASLTSDALDSHKLVVDQLTPELSAMVAAQLPATAGVSNPIDVAGGGEQDITCFARVVDVLAASDEADALVMTGYFGGYSHYDPAVADAEVDAAHAIAAAVADHDASLVVQTIYPSSAPARALRESGVAVYRDVEDAAWALHRLVERGQHAPRALPETVAPAEPVTDTGYWPARRALSAAGIAFGRGHEVRTLDELHEHSAELPFPLVLKALGDEHKSDRGGVVLSLTDRAQLDAAWTDLQDRLAPATTSVEEQLDLGDAVELIVGARHDAAFGTVVLVGLGGVYTELLADIRCALGPVDEAAASALLLGLQGAPLLTGFRGRPRVDLGSAARLVSALSHFAAAHPEIAEVECNPVAATPGGATALDARIILHR